MLLGAWVWGLSSVVLVFHFMHCVYFRTMDSAQTPVPVRPLESLT